MARASEPTRLLAGAAKVDITHPEHPTRGERLYVKALALSDGSTKSIIVTLDAVAIGEIGPIRNDYLETVRTRLTNDFGIAAEHTLFNASHCHGLVCDDVADKTVEAVRSAVAKLEPVKVAVGVGHENRITENRRLPLKDGRTADVRHAYSLPPDDQIAGLGPIDPAIGLVRLDRADGSTAAVLFQFACHPIQGVPAKTNTADISGFAATVVEENLGPEAIALFFQGCGGDINPVYYKDPDHPRDAESLGNLLGLSVLRGVREMKSSDAVEFNFTHRRVLLPRADLAPRITRLEAEQNRLLQSLQGTSLNLKTFLPLAVKYQWSEEFPSYYASRYLQDEALGRDGQKKLDDENRRNLAAYTKNILIMEELTRVQTNLALLKMHHKQNSEAASRQIDTEMVGLRLGDFRLVTSPGELTVQIGLNIKRRSAHPLTFVSGYSNGYIYYTPTEEQLANPGSAQEDCDCLVAPGWQSIFETAALEVIEKL
ncbi:MAG: hypothetical protein U0892_14110 [Pirellulales bacterium]